MKEVVIETYCGLSCKSCEFKEKCHCDGCIASEGRPFFGKCQVAECAKEKKKRFCGECENFPCSLLKQYSNDEEHGDDPKGARIDNCRKIKETLVANAREGVNPVSYCGHHCDYCFMGKWCGGCRSEYNVCSFATLFEDGECPNVHCAKEKGLDGCYDCTELDSCRKGYYGQTEEYVAKATAKFIHKYGVECYSRTLKNAIDAGMKYPQSFDEKKSVDGACKLLEQYIVKS